MGIPCYRFFPAQIHSDSSLAKIDAILNQIDPGSSFGNPQTLTLINNAILNQIDHHGPSFGTLCEILDLFQLPSPILIQILIDIARAVPSALLLSHSYSHSHSSFQIHFPIYILIPIPIPIPFLIPLFRFMQRPGELVWVNTGCVHWVQVGSLSWISSSSSPSS